MATTSRKSCVPDLAEYGLTRERGFLPAQDPLKSLPPAYRAWDHAVQEVSHYILAGVVRPHLERLPLLPVSGLVGGPLCARHFTCWEQSVFEILVKRAPVTRDIMFVDRAPAILVCSAFVECTRGPLRRAPIAYFCC
eukprot:comp20814_c0_seq3/m.27426 comp20814_c0_seq3/g.27426  ORF comp20814_c0_seq3/g.27426 comp20814_c0_seq3/m.27426 type:complete len:137 (-) comp20814_c0_seq3:27-437(-)